MENNRAWFFSDDTKFHDNVYVMYDNDRNYLRYVTDLKSAKILDLNSLKPIIFNVEKTKEATREYLLKWDFLPNSTGLLLVNERALKVLERVAKGDFQALPTKIKMYDGSVINNYHLINIITEKDVLNREKSILYPEDDQEFWDMYEKSYYDKDCMGKNNLLLIKDLPLFLASERVKRAVEKAGLKGLVFSDIYGTKQYIE